ncbi:MAG: uroporphyrinogen decarboxylase family protein [Treponema sp.]|nr:uroporphyrinogen decarboxylase family protein [Treponema sp.]
MNARENFFRTVHFENPDYIPTSFYINEACWGAYRHEMIFDLMESHPLLFPDYRRPKEYEPEYGLNARKDEPFLDDFGCLWKTNMDGLIGKVVGHPLENWDAFDEWKANVPDPEVCTGIGAMDWEKKAEEINKAKSHDALIFQTLRHGHMFLQLSDIRGYGNLLFDFSDEDSRIWELIDIIENFNMEIVLRYMKAGVDVFGYPDDLGMQKGPMISPADFRKYIKPSYERLMKPARERGVLVHMHSDGDIRDLVDDLVVCGVEIINLQDLVNGIDFIARCFAGKTCIELDIDRQNITVFGTPGDIDRHIRLAVEAIGRREGGLMLGYGWYPGTPIENAAAVMDAMEKYSFYFNG